MLPTTLIFWISLRSVSTDSFFISSAGPGVRCFLARVSILFFSSWCVLTGGPLGVGLMTSGSGAFGGSVGKGWWSSSPRTTSISLLSWRTIFRLYLLSLSLFSWAIFILSFSLSYPRVFCMNEVDTPSGLFAMSKKNFWRSGLLIVKDMISTKVFRRICFSDCGVSGGFSGSGV